MPISTTMKAWTYIEDGDRAIFIVPPSQKDQSLIIFDRINSQISTSVISDKDLESPQFFHYAWPARHMMKRMGYDLSRREGLNFEKVQCILLQPFVPKGKSANYYNQTHKGLRYVTSTTTSDSVEESSVPSHSLDLSNWESDVSVGAIFKNLSINMTLIY